MENKKCKKQGAANSSGLQNRPFAHLLPGLETGHPVTVGQSPAYDFSVSDEQKAVFLVSIFDCSECDSYAGDWSTVTGCPVSNPGNNCTNGLFQVEGADSTGKEVEQVDWNCFAKVSFVEAEPFAKKTLIQKKKKKFEIEFRNRNRHYWKKLTSKIPREPPCRRGHVKKRKTLGLCTCRRGHIFVSFLETPPLKFSCVFWMFFGHFKSRSLSCRRWIASLRSLSMNSDPDLSRILPLPPPPPQKKKRNKTKFWAWIRDDLNISLDLELQACRHAIRDSRKRPPPPPPKKKEAS